MKWVLLLLLVSCSSYKDFVQEKYQDQGVPHIIGIDPKNYLIVNQEKPQFKLSFSKKVADAPLLFLLASPTHEMIDDIQSQKYLPIKLKSQQKKQLWQLIPKEDLAAGQSYGIYWQDHKNSSAKLLHTFYVKLKAPALQSHNLFSDREQEVFSNRKYIYLHFDQEIRFIKEDAISIMADGHEGLVPDIVSLQLSSDKKYLEIELSKNFEIDRKYALVLNDSIVNKDQHILSIEPIKFNVVAEAPPLSTLLPLNLAVSHNSLLIESVLNLDHNLEVFLGLKKQGAMDCLNSGCPKFSKANKIKGEVGNLNWFSHMSIEGLLPNTSYQVIIRAEDLQGEQILTGATFSTITKPSLVISEIMANPLIEADRPERHAEFLEFYNVSSEPILLDDLWLSVENLDGSKKKRCALLSDHSDVVIPAQSYVVIAGKDFDQSLYEQTDEILIHRLSAKTICGGLSNQQAKIITLWKNEHQYLDRYQGHKWLTKKGQSINKLDLVGLDTADNYCYSDQAQRPSPGRAKII